MRSNLLFAAVALLAVTLAACSDKSSSPSVGQPSGSVRQIAGCRGSGLARVTQSDSCFASTFYDTLFVDFCLSGNCCPDSNRFMFSSEVSNDTVFVVASDTAAHLCRCTCSYGVRAEFANLPLDRYVVIVARTDYSDRVVFYREDVYRHSISE